MTKNLKINTGRLLPWEEAEEYETLFASLLAEHDPQGPTERHLVEELASIIWRLQRVGVAEAALHRHGLSKTLEPFKDTLKHAFAYAGGSSREASISSALTTTTKERDEELSDTRKQRTKIEKALGFAEDGSYETALKALPPFIVEWWNETLEECEDEEDDDYQATAGSLVEWLRIDVLQWLQNSENALVLHHDIRNQAFGESLDPVKFNELGKWEAHLDRKLERTLAMLVKLRELRPAA